MTSDLERLRRRAKALKKAWAAGDAAAFRHSNALHVIARANFGLQVALLRVAEAARVLDRDPDASTRPVGARTPILHLAFSHHWRDAPGAAGASVAVAHALVANGADVNDSCPAEPGSEHRMSALYGALGHAGNRELVFWLLDNGADPNDSELLYYLTELGHSEGLMLLLRHGARPQGTNAPPRAVDVDDLETVELLLDAGFAPDLDRRNMYGGDLVGTVIHGAEFCPARARRNHLGAAKLILDAGARLYRHDIEHCGVEALAAYFADRAETPPGRVVEDA